MKQDGEMTTEEVAKRIGASVHSLRRWQREGWLTPRTEGVYQGRRLFWSRKDIEEAKQLMHQDSKKNLNDATIDALGGARFIAAFKRAQDVIDNAQPGEVVLAGPDGVRTVQYDQAIGPAIKMVGGIAVLISQ